MCMGHGDIIRDYAAVNRSFCDLAMRVIYLVKFMRRFFFFFFFLFAVGYDSLVIHGVLST